MSESPEIILANRDRIGTLTLNRPRALNALTLGMIEEITRALVTWRSDPSVEKVVFLACDGRAFCAGGDIADLYREGRAGNHDFGRTFWQTEYRLNALIAEYAKPTVCIVDGIVMGGGVGLAAHCSHRIMTENAVFAMPECSIGLIPDVGASLLLAQTPGRCGEYLALSGTRLTAPDCLYAGLCDQHITAMDVGQFLQDGILPPKEAQQGDTDTMTNSLLAKRQDEIDEAFSADTVEQILSRLETLGSDWALETADLLQSNAPLSMATTLSLVRAARQHQSLRCALQDEYRFVSRATQIGSEFLEGTRAAIIDKDRHPNWRYPTMSSLPTDVVQEMRRPAPGGDLTFLEDGS